MSIAQVAKVVQREAGEVHQVATGDLTAPYAAASADLPFGEAIAIS